ncbi:MAG: bifunctional UDP-N-acetylmuramoyl-tripeptide:D-alanyl-D-alanine ligase/alanine racemase [Taibaiella sp.]|nr:bifunctional UDP-N-acetylmuramoyl-tripeptide:D-alanyl-D-alanine ligase/alanine racemase [Taibaiella sp.]
MASVEQIKNWCTGEWVFYSKNNPSITELAIDTRNIQQPVAALFVALKTPLRDGHNYMQAAWDAGVRNFLVSRRAPIPVLADSNILFVPDTLEALQQIAAAHRSQFHIPVIGITGSNGKTVVKEWLSQLLGTDYNTVRSPKSYNSQIGVPLSVWQMADEHKLAVFEAGISQPGEMQKLEPVIQPTIGLFTNIGAAHSEGFADNKQKINEKLLLFRHAHQLVYCTDDALLNECVQQMMQSRGSKAPLQVFTWSATHEATLRITQKQTVAGKTNINALYKGKEIHISIPFSDDASIENAIHCWCIMLLLGVSQEKAEARMPLLQQVSMRMEMRQGVNDCTIINDTYNSDLTSLQLALNFLEQQKQHSRHTVIMSDILQPGKPEQDLYQEVATYISRRNIQRFIGIGPALYKHRDLFKKHKGLQSIFYKSTELFLKKIHLLSFGSEAILLKGARIFAFEKIGLLLEQKVHQTVMTIDLRALKENLDVFRSLLAPGVKTMAMVKAFAYGSGSFEIANLLQYAGVDYLAVAYTDEGVALRKAGIKLPIMVMSPDATSFDRMIAWKLEPELYNFRSFAAFTAIAATLQVTAYPVHIKLDTGMHRLGFNPDDIHELTKQIEANSTIHIASIFSHLAASDDAAEDSYSAQQAARFDVMSSSILQHLSYRPLLHLCNSAAIARHKLLHYDMVRLGLGLYGVDSSATLAGKLQQISALRTSIAQVRDVAAGENIGYGHHTIAPHNMRIATICIGYADGYPRTMGNGKAYVLINGSKAPTVGSICMDMCMVDITAIPGVAEGGEAIVFGPGLPVTQLAAWAGTISYEIMTGISQRVKRVYMNEG